MAINKKRAIKALLLTLLVSATTSSQIPATSPAQIAEINLMSAPEISGKGGVSSVLPGSSTLSFASNTSIKSIPPERGTKLRHVKSPAKTESTGTAGSTKNRQTGDAKDWLNASRIEEGNYKIVFDLNKDGQSKVSILNRIVTREMYNSRPCIKITEINTSESPKTKTIVYIDAKTLKPLFSENSSNDVLVQKAIFAKDKITVVNIENGAEKVTETPISSEPFASSSFSELLQANDFSKNRIINFETINPGNPAGRFKAERIDEKEFSIPGGGKIDCWVLKFTRTDSKGTEGPAGYRYVDKKSGKVVMFKTDINTENFSYYQMLFLN